MAQSGLCAFSGIAGNCEIMMVSRMRKGLLIFFLAFLATRVLSQTQFAVVLGGWNYDIARSLIQVRNGGYAVAGYTNSFGAGEYDVLLAKFDSSGNHEWTRTLGGASDDIAYCLIQTADGGYAVAGQTHSFGAGLADVLLAKFDSSGNHEWMETVGRTSDDIAYSLIQTADGGYALAGETFRGGTRNYDVLLVKFDGSGNHEWTRTLGGTGIDRAYALIQTADGPYAVAGRTDSYGAGCQDVLLTQYDSSGSYQWARTLGGISVDRAYSLVETVDGGYALAGQAKSFGAGLYDLVLARFDTSGYSCLGGSVSPSADTILPLIDAVVPILDSISPAVTDPLPTTSSPDPTWTVLCPFACGDCSGDGWVTFADALYLKNYYYQTPPGSPAPIGQGDVNLDGQVNFADALYIKNYYYQTPPGAPPPCYGGQTLK